VLKLAGYVEISGDRRRCGGKIVEESALATVPVAIVIMMTYESTTPDLQALVTWMAGEFSNQAQAFENPPFFAHIRVCMRPLPLTVFGRVGLFLEQAYDYALDQPYRIRVLDFIPAEGRIDMPHYRLKDEAKFVGAARDRTKLDSLTLDDLDLMCGCGMRVEATPQGFKGRVEPGRQCIVERKGEQSYLDNEFEILEQGQRLISLDRGRDLQTDERLWGSIAGPFEFTRVQNFAHELSFNVVS
jgi:CpeT/CpcT family (DUF1001)